MADIRQIAMDNLAPLVGEWDLRASIGESGGVARSSFEWMLDDARSGSWAS